MRNFAYGCIGVLALVAAFHLGAQTGQAGASGLIDLGLDTNQETLVVQDNGEVWRWHVNVGWSVIGSLPFPPTELKSFNGGFAIDGNGCLWRAVNIPIQWEFLGQPPGSTGIGDHPALEQSTWGRVKHGGGR